MELPEEIKLGVSNLDIIVHSSELPVSDLEIGVHNSAAAHRKLETLPAETLAGLSFLFEKNSFPSFSSFSLSLLFSINFFLSKIMFLFQKIFFDTLLTKMISVKWPKHAKDFLKSSSTLLLFGKERFSIISILIF